MQRGRGLIITGSILLAVSILGGMAAFTVLASRIDVAGLRRDVVAEGDPTAKVPGELRFRVDRGLSGTDRDTMTVAVAVDERTVLPRCSMATTSGAPVDLVAPTYGSTSLSGRSSFTPVVVAELGPGDYAASCSFPGEPSAAPPTTRFTVGRTFGDGDVQHLMGPLLGFLSVAGVAAIMFVLGTILLIVGLVRRSRDRRDGGGPESPSPASVTVTWHRSGVADPSPQPPAPQPHAPQPPARPEMPEWPTPPGSVR